MIHHHSNLAATVDAFGSLKFEIAALEARAAELREAIIAAGPGKHCGKLYDALVIVGDRSTLDMAAVRKHLSPQFIRAHTETKEVTTVKSVMRNPTPALALDAREPVAA